MKKILLFFLILFPLRIYASSIGFIEYTINSNNGIEAKTSAEKQIHIDNNAKIYQITNGNKESNQYFYGSDVITIESINEIATKTSETFEKDYSKFCGTITSFNTIECNNGEFEIMLLKEANIRLGADSSYESLGTIPKNTIITYHNYINDDYDVAWVYVSYNEINGWISLEDYLTKNESSLLTVRDTKLYEDGNVLLTVPKNTNLASKYNNDNKYYVEYNGKKGYIYNATVAIKDSNHINAPKNSVIYEEANISSKEVTKLTEEKTFEYQYINSLYDKSNLKYSLQDYYAKEEYGSYYYIENGEVKGWLFIPGKWENYKNNYEKNIKLTTTKSHEEQEKDISQIKRMLIGLLIILIGVFGANIIKNNKTKEK